VLVTTANKITVGRILLVPLFVVELLTYIGGGAECHRWVAILLFCVAAGTDAVDGYIARRYGQRSDLGAVLDPLADKLLLVLALVVLSLDNRPRLDRIPLWLTATVLCRDVLLLLLMVLVNYLVGHGKAQPHITGKAATVLQMVCVLWALFKWDEDWLFVWAVGATACTAVSGLIYLRNGLRMLRAGQETG
jgi:CDP-diacylglycerol--glycerol-3-phosphate 3-phosphatidyltransferase